MYDLFFRQYADLYFRNTNIDWHYFKAQGMAESNLNPTAKSPANAKGIMQILPATYASIKIVKKDIWDPESNIAAGIFYDKQLWDNWYSERPEHDRLCLMFASYNAGLGNILKAQKLATDKKHWDSIAQCLPKVTGKHATETINYVERIFKFYDVAIA